MYCIGSFAFGQDEIQRSLWLLLNCFDLLLTRISLSDIIQHIKAGRFGYWYGMVLPWNKERRD